MATQLIRVIGARRSGKTTATLDLFSGSSLYLGRTTVDAARVAAEYARRHSTRRVRQLEVTTCDGSTAKFGALGVYSPVGERPTTLIVDTGERLRLDFFAEVAVRLATNRRIIVVSGDNFRDLALWGALKRSLSSDTTGEWLVWCRKGQTPHRSRLR